MKIKKLISFAIVLSFLLTGCNFNSVPDITQSENTIAETEAYNETTPEEVTTAPAETAASTTAAQTTAAAASQTTNTAAETADTSKAEESTKGNVTDPPNDDDPVTQPAPAPVVTEAPVVTTTTTAAPPSEPSPPTIYSTTADGVLASSNATSALDYSNTKDGYVMAMYSGSNSTVKVQVTNPTGTQQIYTIKSRGSFESIPLTAGDGTYTIRICEAVGSKFAVVLDENVSVSLSNSLAPFLRPSNYVNFSYGDSAVTKSSQLCGGAANDLEKVDRVYSWLVDNVTYDNSLAAAITGGSIKSYVPDTEKVINQKIGICSDYAGTMAAMLRSQGIPTQVAVGYAGPAYHACVNLYVTVVGWVYGVIQFDGSAWHRMDPTYAAGSKMSNAIVEFIGDGSNYRTDYLY